MPRLGDDQILREITTKLGETSDSTGVSQTYLGFVDAVHDGMAHLTLETTGGHHLELEWDAAELAAQAIGERQPFTLQTVTTADTMRFKFTPDRLQPLPSQLLQEIDDLTSHYRATGSSAPMASNAGSLRIYLFGATHGESIAIQLPNGKWGVVDCFGSSLTSPAQNPIHALLKRSHVDEIEFLCLTHPHVDHFNGMSQLLATSP